MNTQITTAFACGDKIWVVLGRDARQLTVGRVQVTVTNSPGYGDGDPDGVGIAFDNYKAQQERREDYMCIETGIGSGNVYELGKFAFATQEEAWERIANPAQPPVTK